MAQEEDGPLERLGDNAGDAAEAADKEVEGRVRVAGAVCLEKKPDGVLL